MEVARRVARNAFYNTLTLIFGSFSGLLLSIILARVLKPEYFGIYSLAMVLGNIAIAFSNLGIDNAMIRYISYYSGKNDLPSLRAHFRYFLRIKAIISVVISTILLIFSKDLAKFFNDERLSIPIALAGLLVLFSSLSNSVNSFFRGLQRFDYSFFRQIVFEIGRWVFVIPLALFFLANGAILGISLAHISSLIFMFYLLLKHREYVFGYLGRVSAKVNAYMGFMAIASITGIIYMYVDSIMIGYLIDVTSVGYYRAAYTLVFAIIGILNMAGVLLPVFTQLNDRDINNAVKRLAKYTSVIAFPFAIILAFLSDKIIYVIYGINYVQASSPLAILSFVLIPASFNYLLTIFNAREMPQYSVYITIVSMILNIMLNYVLILRLGISGAALATLISRIFAITLGAVFLKRLDVHFPTRMLSKPALCSILMFLLLITLPKPNALLLGIVEVLIAMVFYFVLIFAVKGVTIDDIRYILRAIGFS